MLKGCFHGERGCPLPFGLKSSDAHGIFQLNIAKVKRRVIYRFNGNGKALCGTGSSPGSPTTASRTGASGMSGRGAAASRIPGARYPVAGDP